MRECVCTFTMVLRYSIHMANVFVVRDVLRIETQRKVFCSHIVDPYVRNVL